MVSALKQYADALNRAEQQFGVSQAVILGILGVETGYGANKGSFITRELTLAFGYPRRAEYFGDELAALIAWTYKKVIQYHCRFLCWCHWLPAVYAKQH